MRHFCATLLGVAAVIGATEVLALPAAADDAQTPKARQWRREIQGRIVRTMKDHFFVELPDKKQLKLYVHPNSKYRWKNKAIQYGELRVGSSIGVVYVEDGAKNLVESVTIVDADEEDEGTLLEGEVVRIVGEEQVIVRTAAGKEVIVFVGPKTRYHFNDREARFTELRKGVHVGVSYDVDKGRNVARRIYTPAKRKR